MPTLLDRLNRRYGRWGVPNVTSALIVGQIAAYVLSLTQPNYADRLTLVPELVLAGQFWRLFTFVVYPPITNPIFALFAWYLLHLMGDALEQQWGAFRYNVYLLIGYFATVAAAFVVPREPGTNAYLLGSIFLAFATLFPNFELSIFFLFPVKVKYLALLTWIGYIYQAVFGDWDARLLVLAAVANYLLFFGRDIWNMARYNKRRMDSHGPRQALAPRRIIHHCNVCGATQDTHPQREFRYCSKCSGSYAYCEEHLRDHVHVVARDGAA